MEQPTNYAVIENGVVINVIWLLPSNASDFPDAIYAGDGNVAIGDRYENGIFVRIIPETETEE